MHKCPEYIIRLHNVTVVLFLQIKIGSGFKCDQDETQVSTTMIPDNKSRKWEHCFDKKKWNQSRQGIQEENVNPVFLEDFSTGMELQEYITGQVTN